MWTTPLVKGSRKGTGSSSREVAGARIDKAMTRVKEYRVLLVGGSRSRAMTRQSTNQNGGANEVDDVSKLQAKGKFLYSTSDTKQLTAEKRRAGAFIPIFEERG